MATGVVAEIVPGEGGQVVESLAQGRHRHDVPGQQANERRVRPRGHVGGTIAAREDARLATRLGGDEPGQAISCSLATSRRRRLYSLHTFLIVRYNHVNGWARNLKRLSPV